MFVYASHVNSVKRNARDTIEKCIRRNAAKRTSIGSYVLAIGTGLGSAEVKRVRSAHSCLAPAVFYDRVPVIHKRDVPDMPGKKTCMIIIVSQKGYFVAGRVPVARLRTAFD